MTHISDHGTLGMTEEQIRAYDPPSMSALEILQHGHKVYEETGEAADPPLLSPDSHAWHNCAFTALWYKLDHLAYRSNMPQAVRFLKVGCGLPADCGNEVLFAYNRDHTKEEVLMGFKSAIGLALLPTGVMD